MSLDKEKKEASKPTAKELLEQWKKGVEEEQGESGKNEEKKKAEAEVPAVNEPKAEEKESKKGGYYSFLADAGQEKKEDRTAGGVKLDLFAAKKGKVEAELFFVKKPKASLGDLLKDEGKEAAVGGVKPHIDAGFRPEREESGGMSILKTFEKAKVEEMSAEGEGIEAGEGYKIVRKRGEKLLSYIVSVPSFTEEEKKLMKEIEMKAIAQLDIEPDAIAVYSEKKKLFNEKVREFIERSYPQVARKNLKWFVSLIVQDMIGYGPLDPLINDDALEEIMLVGRNIPVFVYHRKHGMCKTNIIFEEDESAIKIISRIARAIGRRIDATTPLLDARLKDGSRVNATVPPISLDGPTLTIRKFRADPLTFIDILNFKTMSVDLVAFLWLAVEGFEVKPSNILVSGGTGSGKTTTLNCIGSFIPSSSRVISIEDTAELQIPVKHWVRLETRPPNLEGKGEISMEVLLKNTLRMRPDRIIVGEVRGKEAGTLLAAMNTGQSGCMGTLHANNARETITRLTSEPMSVPLIMIPALNIIIMQNRFSYKGKTVRRITEVAEVAGIEKGEIMINNIFEWDPKTDTVVPTGAPSKIKHRLAELRGVGMGEIDMEIERRKKVIEWMLKTGVKGIKNVGAIINEYYINKEKLLAKIEGREYKEEGKDGKKDKKEGTGGMGIVHLFETEQTEKEVIAKNEWGQLVRYPDEKNPVYEVFLPKTSKEERRLLREIESNAVEKINIDPAKVEDKKEAEKIFSDAISKLIKERFGEIGSARVKELTKIVVNSLIGFSYLEPLLKDLELEEIMVIGTGKPVYVNHAKFGICRTNISFDEDKETEHIIEKIATSVGRRIDKATPLLDARLKDGSRVNATIPPISVEGPTLTIRKFKPDPLTIIDLINFKTITMEAAAYFWLMVEGWGIKPANILIAGGSGCGKTTLLNSFCMFVPDTQRLISIEDTAELRIPAKHWLRMETKPPSVEGKGEVTMDDLVKNTLRMRPDRVLVGEVRGSEARTLFTAMNTGHDGCMGTLHSNSARETITKLTNPPMNVPPIMIPALDIVVMEQKIYFEGNILRRITEVAEITEASGGEDGAVALNTVYQWNPKKDLVEPTGVPSVGKQRLAKLKGLDIRDIDGEIEKRRKLLEYMVKNKIRRIDDVAKIVQRYYAEGEELLKEIENSIKAANKS